MAKTECAGFEYEDNFCCHKDKICTFWTNDSDDTDTNDETDNNRCTYFETSVLPLDHGLEREYWDDKNIAVEKKSKPKSRIVCERCKAIVEANSNRQQYCDNCKKIIRKEQTRNAVQKSRNK